MSSNSAVSTGIAPVPVQPLDDPPSPIFPDEEPRVPCPSAVDESHRCFVHVSYGFRPRLEIRKCTAPVLTVFLAL